MNEQEFRSLVADVVGARITKISRVYFVYSQEVDRSKGPIEFSLSGNSVVAFDSGADGESLTVTRHAWKDPFEGKLDDKNEKFIARHGKWTRFDVTSESAYGHLVGKQVQLIDLISLPKGSVVGVVLRLEGSALVRIEVQADDLYVQVV